MKKILLSLAATAALAAAAAPAAAQPWRGDDHRGDYGRGYDHGQRMTAYVDSLDWKIDNAVRERRVSWREARQLKAELRQAQSMAWRVETGQANRWERQRLDQIVNRIEVAVNGRYDRRDGRDYGYGYGYRR